MQSRWSDVREQYASENYGESNDNRRGDDSTKGGFIEGVPDEDAIFGPKEQIRLKGRLYKG